LSGGGFPPRRAASSLRPSKVPVQLGNKSVYLIPTPSWHHHGTFKVGWHVGAWTVLMSRIIQSSGLTLNTEHTVTLRSLCITCFQPSCYRTPIDEARVEVVGQQNWIGHDGHLQAVLHTKSLAQYGKVWPPCLSCLRTHGRQALGVVLWPFLSAPWPSSHGQVVSENGRISDRLYPSCQSLPIQAGRIFEKWHRALMSF
jgi:hypothetical protein